MRQWRVAILGLGHWYSAFALARALPEYPHATLVAAAWPNDAQREEFGRTFGVPTYSRYEDLLDREEVDIVHIAAPVADLKPLTLLAASLGKHMVLGKPMAMTVADADEMVRAVEASGVVCVPFQAITRLRIAEIKNRIDAGEIGDILLLHQTCRWSIAEDWFRSGRPGWFADPARVPGGALIDEGIYWIDAFGWLTGSEVVSVETRIANLVHKDIAVEDWGMATLTFANGVFGTLECSWTINAPRATGPSPKQNAVVRLEVVGSRGELVDQSFRMPGRAILAAGAEDWVFERRSEEPFAPTAPAPLSHLIACLEGKTAPIATIRDARQSLRVALAAYESARNGQGVRRF